MEMEIEIEMEMEMTFFTEMKSKNGNELEMELEQEWKRPDKNGTRMRSRKYLQNGNITAAKRQPLLPETDR